MRGENITGDRGCEGVRGLLRGGGRGEREGTKPGHGLVLGYIIYKTAGTEDSSQR